MTNRSNSDTPSTPQDVLPQVKLGRRRLLRAGLASAPVVLAVTGRSAMATTTCSGLSPLAWASMAPNGTCVGTSHTVNSHPLGYSPGGWTPNCGPSANVFQWNWPTSVKPFYSIFDYNNVKRYWSSGWSTFKGIPSTATGWGSGTKCNAVLGGTDTRTFSQVLLAGNVNTDAKWHLCAAYLNAASMGGNYALTTADVIRLWQTGQLVVGGPVLTASQIKTFLNQTWA